MATVFLTTIEPAGLEGERESLRRLANQFQGLAESSNEHDLVEDPADADIILLNAAFTLHWSHVDRARLSVRRHPLTIKYPYKTFVFDPDDDPSPFVPGVFASLDVRNWEPEFHRAGPYLHNLDNPLCDWRMTPSNAEYLFSFVGATSTHPVRRTVEALKSSRSLIITTNAQWPQHPTERAAFKSRYANSIHQSKFVLCPRGRGTSSARLFEAMRAGRVPVIISDHWVAPLGPAWDRCSIRVAERDVPQIPRLLHETEWKVPEMAQAARATFDEWFSHDRVFGRIVDWCLQLKASQAARSRRRRISLAFRVWRPTTFMRFVITPVLDRMRYRTQD